MDSPEDIIPLYPSETKIIEVQIKNKTDWPWKQGCTLVSLPFTQELSETLEAVEMPVEQYIGPKEKVTFKIPLTVKQNAKLMEVPFHVAKFGFRGPHGRHFGEMIALKFKVVQKVDQIEIYQKAMDILEN